MSSTGEENVTKSFLDLYKPPDLPPIFKDGFMDPNIAKFHLLLHDNAAENPPKYVWTLLLSVTKTNAACRVCMCVALALQCRTSAH